MVLNYIVSPKYIVKIPKCYLIFKGFKNYCSFIPFNGFIFKSIFLILVDSV